MLRLSQIRAQLGVGWVCLSIGCAGGGDELPAPRTETVNQEIVGGTAAPRGEFPGFASLRDASGQHICGGTLIAPSWVLTAGHCISTQSVRGDIVEVVVGGSTLSSNDGEHLKVERAFQHPDWNDDVLFPANDVGLLRLATPSSAPVVRLAPADLLRHLHPGTKLRVTGFGTTDEDADDASDALLFAEVPLVPRRECARVYGKFLLDSLFCAGYPKGGIDACYGDSGGPLFADDGQGPVQLAVVTGGIGCARPEWYGLYTNVARYDAWIASTRAQGDAEAPALAPCFARCEADNPCAPAGNEPASWSCARKVEACLCTCGGDTTSLCASDASGEVAHDSEDDPSVPADVAVDPSEQRPSEAPVAAEAP
jgi:hypothetical protein